MRLVGVPAAIALSLSTCLTGCMGYVPFSQTYWDQQVKALCEKDGGETVFEIGFVNRQEYELFRSGIRPEEYSGAAPIVRRTSETVLNEWNPKVVRIEQSAVRLVDGKILATNVSYFRSGGGLPTGFSESTSFVCPGGPALKMENIVKVKD